MIYIYIYIHTYIYVYIYSKRLKEVWDCFIKIHFQDEITSAASEHCEGLEVFPSESHMVFCHPVINMALSGI